MLVTDPQADRKTGYLRRGVVVLEEVEVGATGVLHLVADGLTRGAGEGRDDVGVTGRHSELAQVLLDSGGVVVGGRRASGGLERSKVDLTIAAEGVGRSLEVLLVGEEEDQAARLAGVRGGDIKVEDARDAGGDGAVVGGTRSVVGLGGVDGDDQMRVLVVAREISGAAAAGGLSAGGLSTSSRLGGLRRRSLGSAGGRHRGLRARRSLGTGRLRGSRTSGHSGGARAGDSDDRDSRLRLRAVGGGHGGMDGGLRRGSGHRSARRGDRNRTAVSSTRRRGRHGHRARARARAGTRARVGHQRDVLTLGDLVTLGGVQVHSAVLTSRACNEAGITVVRKLTLGVDGEAGCGSGTRIALELRGVIYLR